MVRLVAAAALPIARLGLASRAPAADDLDGDPLPPGARARLRTIAFHSPDGVAEVALSPDGRYLASTGSSPSVHLWDTATGRQVRTLTADLGRSCLSVVFSPDGKRLACVTDFGNQYVWDVATGKRELPYRAPGRTDIWFAAPAYQSNDTAVLVFQGDDPTEPLSLYDTRTRKRPFNFPQERVRRGSAVPACDGNTLAATRRKNALLFDLATGQELGLFPVSDREAEALALSRGGRRLAVGDASEEVSVWDAATGKELRRVPGHQERDATSSGQALAQSPDGAVLAVSECGKYTIRLYNVGTGKADPPTLKRLTDALDSADLGEREKAEAEPARDGEAALPEPRQARQSSSAEVRRRAEAPSTAWMAWVACAGPSRSLNGWAPRRRSSSSTNWPRASLRPC
jgi:WD40 repeat protein